MNPPFNSASSNWISVTCNQKSPVWYPPPPPPTPFLQHLKDTYLVTHLFWAPNINYLIWLDNSYTQFGGNSVLTKLRRHFPTLLSYQLLILRWDFRAWQKVVKRLGDMPQITEGWVSGTLPVHEHLLLLEYRAVDLAYFADESIEEIRTWKRKSGCSFVKLCNLCQYNFLIISEFDFKEFYLFYLMDFSILLTNSVWML